ncbi:MAG: hypothetical protein V4618_13880 [Pseudomonadota bacterium]
MELIILQTSDAFKYSRMLRASSRTAIEYCRRNGFAYESFVGIKRGVHGAQAAFNRIFMLDELIERGYSGWALHMDADAYIHDMDFDLKAYLADKQHQSAIMATIPGETVPWHINSGVLFFNLAHPQAAMLIREWKRRFMAIPDERLQTLTSVWDHDNDQTMLYQALDENPALREPVLFEDALLFNHHQGRFIRQFLNSLDSNIDSRTATIEAAVRDVLEGAQAAAENSVEERLVGDFYRIILGREPDPGSKGYAELLASQGIRAVSDVVSSLLNSEEYRRRIGG